MPNGKSLLWTVGLAAATFLAIEHYRNIKGGSAPSRLRAA